MSRKGIEDRALDPVVKMRKDEKSQSQNRVNDQTPGPVHQLRKFYTFYDFLNMYGASTKNMSDKARENSKS